MGASSRAEDQDRRGWRDVAGRWGWIALILAVVPIAGCGADGAVDGGATPASGAPETVTTTPPPRTADRPPPNRGLAATVARVIDGDTIRVRSRGFETVVRLIGIDTPETRRPGTVVQCFGPQASRRAAQLLPVGEPVRLETDPTQARRDRYDRLLAYVYRAGRTGPTGSVNYALVAGGYATVYVYGGVPFRDVEAFRDAQSLARERAAGLWGPPCNGDTTKPAPAASTAAPSTTRQAVPLAGAANSTCDANYRGACIPPYPPDVDCADLGGASVTVVGADPHRLDGDGDGTGCE